MASKHSHLVVVKFTLPLVNPQLKTLAWRCEYGRGPQVCNADSLHQLA